jgi:ABC-2 type transport system ATP-binding protein
MNGVIQANSLVKRFRGVTALDGLDLSVDEGGIYALIGANGAGKSTLIKILMNIVEPTSGSASLLGASGRALTPGVLARIGYVAEGQRMPEWMTVRQLMDYCAPFYPGWDRHLEADLLRSLDLPTDRKLGHMSRGMRMKAALASSLAYRPSVLILDEPFSGLDPLVREEFVEGMLDRASSGGTTILVASHDLGEIETVASHVGFIDQGRLVFSEEMQDLAGRFREVQVSNPEGAAPDRWPETWLEPKVGNGLVRFVESRFDEHRTRAQVRGAMPGSSGIEIRPLGLRAIFVALARASRRAA